MSNRDVPAYYSQWVSNERIPDLLAGRLHAVDDPRWAESGAPSAEAYARWASHICGMACTKMLLEELCGERATLFELLERCREVGGYVVSEAGIKGLYYRPLVQLLRERHALQAEVVEHVEAERLAGWLDEGHRVIASVHPSIRTPEQDPPQRGGHLVYLFGRDESGRLRFHNPSGLPGANQADARLAPAVFERFFAGRGILIRRG
ncbi:C39 family peptidase [Halomonas sp. KM-1]|uniref:C39 family peptidase n=1 Tax=Halomonas sp. KM-1 TaxID=590061 RepID=UPI0002881502|nr:C39 family peptidase [Halomonas sp. KM-1]